MCHTAYLTKRTFGRIFKNLAKELNVEVSKVFIGIKYRGGAHYYMAYLDFVEVKEIKLDSYTGAVVDWSGATALVEATIVQAGAAYARELEAPIDDLCIVLRHREDEIPAAVLLNNMKKVRDINIEDEFLRAVA